MLLFHAIGEVEGEVGKFTICKQFYQKCSVNKWIAVLVKVQNVFWEKIGIDKCGFKRKCRS